MKQTVTDDMFTDVMTSKGYGFTYEGSKALFEHLTQFENDCDKEEEFDPIALRCDFDEYDSLKKVKENYQEIKNLDDLKNYTTVIEIPGTKRLIIQAY